MSVPPDFDSMEYRIGRLELRPGDMLVIKVTGNVPSEQVMQMAEDIREIVKSPVLVIDQNIDLSVLTKEEIAARAG